MEHVIIIYPSGSQSLPEITETLQKHGKVIQQKTIELNGQQAFGYLMMFYWNPKYLDLKSLRDKVVKSGWKSPYDVAPITIIHWKSSSKKISQDLLQKDSSFKCYLRQVAYYGKSIKWEDFQKSKPSAEECRLWKGTLHSPDDLSENQRIIPLFFHDSTVAWFGMVSWEDILGDISNWSQDFDVKKGHFEWSSTGQLVASKKVRGDDGVYWLGYWMSIPPITKNQWEAWIADSKEKQTGGQQLWGKKLWSHPATFEYDDLKKRNKSDYLMSWKADGLHGVLELKDGKWVILDEKGGVMKSGVLSEYGRKLAGTNWEGEYLPEKEEFLAFDMPTQVNGNYWDRMKRPEQEWANKKKSNVLWEGLPISDTLTLLWKPFHEVKNVEKYLKDVEESGYGSDGLIFMPQYTSWKDFGEGDANQILKWKSGKDQTVDVYVFNNKVWLRDYNPSKFAPVDFACKTRGSKKNYPREWTYSRLSPKNPPKVEWKDGTTAQEHNGEIWEIRWKTTVNKNVPNYLWEAVRRRDSNKEVLLRNIGGMNAICDGRFVGPNAWRTMESVESVLMKPVGVNDLERW